MPTFTNKAHYNDTAFEWDPSAKVFSGGIEQISPGYLTELLALQGRVRAGTAKPWEADELKRYETEARAIPTRDIASLTAGWQGESQGQWTDNGWQEGSKDWWKHLDPMSPDVGPIVLQLREKIERGQATDKERELFQGVMSMAGDWDYRASRPQASDAFNPLGDQFFGALGVLGLGATGGLAAAPLFAGGAGLATTLGSLGSLAGVAGTAAGALGQEMDQDWLQKLGLGLGAVGGITSGVSGLANLWGTGINSVSDAAKLASNAGRIAGGVGQVTDNDTLKQAASYLSATGQAGSGLDAIAKTLSGDGVTQWSDVARLAGNVGDVTQAAGRVTGNERLKQIANVLNLAKRFGGNRPAADQQAGQTRPVTAQVNAPLLDQDWLRSSFQQWQQPPLQSTLWNLPTR